MRFFGGFWDLLFIILAIAYIVFWLITIFNQLGF